MHSPTTGRSSRPAQQRFYHQVPTYPEAGRRQPWLPISYEAIAQELRVIQLEDMAGLEGHPQSRPN